MKSVSQSHNAAERRRCIRWLRQLLRTHRGSIYRLFLISLLSLVISHVGTIAGKFLVDHATGGVLSIRSVVVMAVTSGAAILLGVGTRTLSDYISEKFTFSLRSQLYSDLLKTTWPELTHYHTGDMVTRLTSDLNVVASGLIQTLPGAVLALIQLLLSFGILLYFDPSMALLALAIGPLGSCIALLFRRKYQQYQTQLRENESEYRTFMQESLSGIAVVKAFQQEDAVAARMEQIRSERLQTVLRCSRMSALLSACSRLVYTIGYLLAFCWGTYRLSLGTISFGTLTIFITLVSQVQSTMGNLIRLIPQGHHTWISARRLHTLADLPKEAAVAAHEELCAPVSIEVKDLRFAYGETPILDGISFQADAGQCIGITGPSGVGKTTLIRLLLSLLSPDSGNIHFRDAAGNLHTADISTRALISYVPQGNTLFCGTVAQNLRLADPEASDAALWQALELADAAQFVREMPQGLHTALKENAGGLSEGQAQRIAIARALLRGRPILILDEATSALDASSESAILHRLTGEKDRICLLVSHRQTALQYCTALLQLQPDGSASFQSL